MLYSSDVEFSEDSRGRKYADDNTSTWLRLLPYYLGMQQHEIYVLKNIITVKYRDKGLLHLLYLLARYPFIAPPLIALL